MAAEAPQEPEGHPRGFPEIVVAGRAVSLRLFIPGTPVAKARPRSRVVTPKDGKAPWVNVYSDDKMVAWEDLVAIHAKNQIRKVPPVGEGQDFRLPLDGRIVLSLRFNMHKPVSYPKSLIHHTKKPDVDNLAKAVLDGLAKGRVIVDDAAVTDSYAYKRYEVPGHPEGVEIDMTVVVG